MRNKVLFAIQGRINMVGELEIAKILYQVPKFILKILYTKLQSKLLLQVSS